jgi:hypothetical protein
MKNMPIADQFTSSLSLDITNLSNFITFMYRSTLIFTLCCLILNFDVLLKVESLSIDTIKSSYRQKINM